MTTNSDYPTIMVGTCIHNKVWSIEAYLNAIFEQSYPKDRISLVFYVNDSIDGTKEKLVDLLKTIKKEGHYRRIRVVEQNYGYEDIRRKHKDLTAVLSREHDPSKAVANFAHFARVRNAWLKLREDEEYYLSIDSDVILAEANTFKRMIRHGLDLVAAPVNNTENRTDGFNPSDEAWAKLLKMSDSENRDFLMSVKRSELKEKGGAIGPTALYNFGMLRGGQFLRFAPLPKLMEVDVTGACILFHSKIIRRGVEYGPNYLGEDVFFCTLARSFGFKVFVDGTLKTEHFMDKNPNEEKEEVKEN